MLSGTVLAPQTVVAKIPPSWAKATTEKIAVNAVMAGCLPAYMPVIIAAVRAMTDPALNLNGMQCSTHLPTPLVVVNGPARIELGMNSGSNVFGQGNRANATIGRAVKLILTNIGRAIPGVTEGDPGPSREIYLLHCRERRAKPLGAAARGAWLQARAKRGDGVRMRGPAQRQQPS